MRKNDQTKAFHDNLTIGIAAAAIVGGALVAWRQWNVLSPLLLVEQLLGLGFMAAAARCDIKTSTIPNKLVLAMLGVWALLKVVAVGVLDIYPAMNALIASLSGGGFALFVFGIVYLATKRQMGGGDVKLATVMGLYLTSLRVLGGILYGLIICAVYSLVMLALKKIGKKDTVPLAPFLAVGYLISMLFIF